MFQVFFRHGRCSQGNIGESWNQVRQTVSAIEAIFEIRQIALRIFRIKRVIAAAQGCLEIAQHRIDPALLRFLHRGTTATADDRLMRTSDFSDGIKTFQTVRDDMSAGGRLLSGPSGDLPFAEALNHGKLDALRMTLIIGLHGHQKVCLVGVRAYRHFALRLDRRHPSAPNPTDAVSHRVSVTFETPHLTWLKVCLSAR